MTCRQLAELLIDFVSGELPPEQREVLERHLRLCPPCVTYVETYKMTMHLTRKLPCRELPPDVAERLLAALKNPKPE